MDIPLVKDEVLPQLWAAYKKSNEYAHRQTKAIPAHYPLVKKHETEGLTRIYRRFIENLRASSNANQILQNRTIRDWLSEWKKMHDLLFESILKERGTWRKKDVRFGNPGDEVLYGIPPHTRVPQEVEGLAHSIHQELTRERSTLDEKCIVLAKVHYQFVRIHPFIDGNGRIARAITDQLALYFDLPPAMAGYPRHDSKRRESYHKAIRSCVDDPECRQLSLWIRGYIEKQLEALA